MTDGKQLELKKACTERGNTWYVLGTERSWVDVLVTPDGFVRVGKPVEGAHPVFTVQEDEEVSDE